MVVTIQEHPFNSPNYRLTRIRIDSTHTIRATVTCRLGVVRRWIRRIFRINDHLYYTNRLVVGCAKRSTPVSYNTIPATTQLFVNNSCLIYHHLHTTDPPNALTHFLDESRITFVTVWPRLSFIARFLASNPWFSLFYNMAIDVRFFIRDHQGNPVNADFGIYHIATEVLGLHIQPELRNVEDSNWEVMQLTNAQIAQACLDAFVPYKIGMHLRIWNINRNLFFFNLILVSMLTILMHSLEFI